MARLGWLVTVMATAVWVSVAAQQAGQTGPANLDFESGAPGELPTGWMLAVSQPQPGVSARIVTDDPRRGAQAALLARDATAAPNSSLNLLQILDAAPYRGRRVRFRMAVRVDTPGSPAQMWMRIDGQTPPGQGQQPPSLFLDTMDDRPIARPEWGYSEIVADVPTAANRILIGVYTTGVGKAWVDDASFETVTRPDATIPEGPKALSRRGLANLLALTRLTGYVRHFHPSDEALQTDWPAFTIAALRNVESAADGDALTRRLADLFRPIAPTISVIPSGTTPPPAAPPPEGTTRQLTWRHLGLGLSSAQILYRSERLAVPQPAQVFAAEIGAGVSVRIPLSVAADETGTLPRTSAAPNAAAAAGAAQLTRGRFSMNDRATRLATIILAWNVFQHSYPYFDVVKTNWASVLSTTLQEAATDQNEREFVATLRRMVAALNDGQARVLSTADADLQFTPPLLVDWVENALVVVAADPATGALPGDIVVAVDGTPAPLMLEAAEAFVSGATPQWKRVRAMQELLTGPKDSPVKLRVERGADTVQRLELQLTRSVTNYAPNRGDTIKEVQPGIFYVDAGRITEAEFTAALPRLEVAKGLVFDLRTSPAALGPDAFFTHLTQKPITSPQFHLPQIVAPDREQMTFARTGEWTITPKPPYLAARKIFLTDAHAIGYGESCLEMIEAHMLGDIVGSPSAGTNGTVNRFPLPGDYTILFTGTKVLKHDGSVWHGAGVKPAIAVTPTRAGIAGGRDELLDRAVQTLVMP